jgi:DNA processing protein
VKDFAPGRVDLLDERSARTLFNLVPGVTALRFRSLVDRFGSATAALNAPPEDWAGVDGLPGRVAEALYDDCRKAVGRLAEELAAVEKLGARVIMAEDDEFPEGLKPLADAPIVLYIRGEYKPVDSMAVALVGSRTPTDYGRTVAERLARELTQAGVTIVSGLARGIDTASHAAVVKSGGRTIGVLGSGFNRFYPGENRALADRMAQRGAVISEFPLATEPDRGNFPRRNRVISGLSLAVVVVEADEQSGALITARLAAEQGRDVFAVPGSVFSKMSKGPHRLIRQGARVVETAEDILDEIEVFRSLSRPKPAPAAEAEPLDPTESRILGQLSLDPVTADALSAKTGLAASALSPALLHLELKGLVRALPGQNYVKSERGLEMTAAS